MPFSPWYHVAEDRRAYTVRSGGEVGCLMLHGFLGSPTSSRPMAEFLGQQGITVHCPLLPGHGELPERMAGVSRHAWIDEAEEGLAQLRAWCDEIVLIGHSMGTVLAAKLASDHADLRGMVMLAPLYKVPNRFIHALRVLRYVMPWFYPWYVKPLRRLTRERVLDLYPDLDFDDPEVKAWLPRATRVPTGAIDEMRKMADLGRRLWPQLALPMLLLQGEQDIAVKPGNTKRIHEMLGSSNKTLHKFPKAGHELMRPFEPVHARVWSLVYAFVRQHATVPLESLEALRFGTE